MTLHKCVVVYLLKKVPGICNNSFINSHKRFRLEGKVVHNLIFKKQNQPKHFKHINLVLYLNGETLNCYDETSASNNITDFRIITQNGIVVYQISLLCIKLCVSSLILFQGWRPVSISAVVILPNTMICRVLIQIYSYVIILAGSITYVY